MMNRLPLDLAGLAVESFQITDPPCPQPPALEPEPETVQSGPDSICFVSCGGTCGC
jgi:hypothetical protein